MFSDLAALGMKEKDRSQLRVLVREEKFVTPSGKMVKATTYPPATTEGGWTEVPYEIRQWVVFLSDKSSTHYLCSGEVILALEAALGNWPAKDVDVRQHHILGLVSYNKKHAAAVK